MVRPGWLTVSFFARSSSTLYPSPGRQVRIFPLLSISKATKLLHIWAIWREEELGFFEYISTPFIPESSPRFLNGIAIVPAITTTVLMPEQAPLDNVVPATTLGLDAAPAPVVVRPKRRWTWSMGMRRADIENQDQEREPTGPGEL